ncbi:MAG: membrane protein insertase YidC [Bdellovibrionota bacterium]
MGSEQRNALLAVVLSGLILFGWQYYFVPKKAPAPVEPVTTSVTAPTTATNTTIAQGGPIEPSSAPVAETFTVGQSVKVEFTNNLTFTNMTNPQAGNTFAETTGSAAPAKVEFDFGMGKGWQSLQFQRVDETKFHNAESDMTLSTAVDEKGIATFTLTSPNVFKYRFTFVSEAKKLENNQHRIFSFYTDSLTNVEMDDDETGDRAIKWAGIDFDYHLFGIALDKETSLLYKSSLNNFTMFSNKGENSLKFHTVFVKKEYNYLSSLGHNLQNSVDFGIWGFFAVWILKGLQFFYKFIPNYGISIILLTLLIRLITFPLQWKSTVSMKKLQEVQPQLTKIREKFKDDPARLQKESMELFKKSGANPMGGCLPLLLQMPVFFAFYKVLYSAVELVDAPFILWLHDLSNKDPYYVLPVLMTVAMFLQQRLTPNTIADPVQKKIMMFMPLIFGFIMKDLPSGLCLYIFVSTLFGILQQVLVFNTGKSNKLATV